MNTRGLTCLLVTCLSLNASAADSEKTDRSGFPAKDSTVALQAIINSGVNRLELTERSYRITAPLEVSLDQNGRLAVLGEGVTLIMDGPGPALKLIGTHTGTADPGSFEEATFRQFSPQIQGLEIVGNHPEANGIEIRGTVGTVLSGVIVRRCRHAVQLTDRNRNVVVQGCHFYENSGVGLYLDDVNLHQINVTATHISYNKGGGIVVRDGNVRNLHVTGCDLESNMPTDGSATSSANILLDVSGSADDRSRSIAEIAITGCTIQHAANYSGHDGACASPGGANIRLLGKPIYPIDTVTITGNLLSDTETNIDLQHASDITLSGNSSFAPFRTHLRAEHCRQLTIVGNTWNPRQFVRPGTFAFRDCHSVLFSRNQISNSSAGTATIQIHNCADAVFSGVLLNHCRSGWLIQGGGPIYLEDCRTTGPFAQTAAQVRSMNLAPDQLIIEGGNLHRATDN